MKGFKILIFIFFSNILLGQTSVFLLTDKDYNNAIVNDGTKFYHGTLPNGATVVHEFELKNTSSVTQTISIRKYDDVINTVNAANDDMGHAFFCFGASCLLSTTYSFSVELMAGEVVLFEAKFDEASVAGHSTVRYKLNNKLNSNDAVTITLNYDSHVGLNKNKEDNNISYPYPNPSTQFINFDVNSLTQISDIRLLNVTGQMVSLNEYEIINSGKTISINTKQLESGIYFVQIINDKISIIKKITLIK